MINLQIDKLKILKHVYWYYIIPGDRLSANLLTGKSNLKIANLNRKGKKLEFPSLKKCLFSQGSKFA